MLSFTEISHMINVCTYLKGTLNMGRPKNKTTIDVMHKVIEKMEKSIIQESIDHLGDGGFFGFVKTTKKEDKKPAPKKRGRPKKASAKTGTTVNRVEGE